MRRMNHCRKVNPLQVLIQPGKISGQMVLYFVEIVSERNFELYR
jgi:hypothetical protein